MALGIFFTKFQREQPCLKIFIALLWLLFSNTPSFATDFFYVNENSQETVVIRVGYTDYYGVNPSPRVSGNEGYLYEYLNKIAEYTDIPITFEFISIEIEDTFGALESGEVDVVGPLNKTAERLEKYIFTGESFGEEVSFLSALHDENKFYGDYAAIEGSGILVQESSDNVRLLENFLQEHGISATVIPKVGNEFAVEMQNGQGDYCLSSSMVFDSRLKPVAKLGEVPIFYMAMAENQYILDILDEGMEKLHREEYLYDVRLYLKYYDFQLQDRLYISQEEYQVVQDVNVYNVGINADLSVLSYINEQGQPAGVLVDMMNALGEIAHISFHYVPVTLENLPEGLDLLLFPWDGMGEYDQYKESPTFLELPLMMVKKYNYVDNLNKIGIVQHYVTCVSTVESYFPDQEIILFDSYDELYQSYDNNQVDSIILTTISLNDMRNTLNLEENSVTPIASVMEFALSYGGDFPAEKIEILNKLLTHVDEAQLEYSILQHSSATPEENWWDYWKDHPQVPTLLIIFYFILLRLGEKKKKLALQKLIDYDDVTGLFSERKFIEEAEQLMKINPEKKYSLIAFDIDNFKYINEIYHYEGGTSVLHVLGNYVREVVPDAYPVARCFSDNFLVFLETEGVLQKIQRNMEKQNEIFQKLNELIGESYSFSFSIGVYHIENHKIALSYMIDCANLARGLGKKTIGTTMNVFSHEMSQERAFNNEIVATMDHAVAMREFEMYFQPKFTISGEKICGAEALVRWNQGHMIVSPGVFIPVFEKNGFIEKLDYYVVEEVCRFIHENKKEKLPMISLNLSGITIMKPNLVENLLQILQRYQVKPCELEIEMTESALVDHFDLAIQKMNHLQNLGFTLSIDDFGTGISTLHRLKEIDVDVLKIDRAFVVDSLEHQRGAIILKNIITMAKELELKTVVEGIETQEQLEFLNRLGCDVGQGYYYSRPLQGKDFLERLRQDALGVPHDHLKKLRHMLKS